MRFIIKVNFFSNLSKGFTVSVGAATDVAINRLYSRQKERPYSECIPDLVTLDAFDSLAYRSLIKAGEGYRQIDCYDVLYAIEVIKQCNCYDIYMILPVGSENVSACLANEQVTCNFNIYSDFYNKDLKSMQAATFCPLECESMKYSLTTSFADYPGRAYGEYLRKLHKVQTKFPNGSFTFDDLKKSVLRVRIFYDSLQYTSIKEEPVYSIIDLISVIGKKCNISSPFFCNKIFRQSKVLF